MESELPTRLVVCTVEPKIPFIICWEIEMMPTFVLLNLR